MNSKHSISREKMRSLKPTTRNILSLLSDTPVIVIKRDSGRIGAGSVYEELRSLSGNGFQVFENEDGMSIVRDGASRNFLV